MSTKSPTTPVVTAAAATRRAPVRRPRRAPGSTRVGPVKLLGTAVIWAFTIFNVFVLYWLLVSSFKTPREIFSHPFGLPHDLFSVGRPFRNWATAWVTSGFGTAFLNTVIVVGLASVAIIIVAAPAAYALSRLGARGSAVMTNFFAIGMGVPFQTVIIPLFIVLAKVGLTNSMIGLFLIYVALSLPFTVFLLTGFFRSLPNELEEAAAVDGASALRIFGTVMLPLARGGVITALILNAIGLWNETLLAIVFLQDNDKYTIARALFSFYGTMTYNSDWGGLMAGVAIVVLPMLVLYMLLARRIIAGLTLGAGK